MYIMYLMLKNSSGLIKITTTVPHGYTTGDRVHIKDILGTVEANNTSSLKEWSIIGVDAYSFTLDGSVFVNTYVTGGTLQRISDFDLILNNLNAYYCSNFCWMFIIFCCSTKFNNIL